MSYLADRILADGGFIVVGTGFTEHFDPKVHAPAISESIKTAPRIDATNITHHYYAESEREHWFLENPQHFPSFAPPFEEWWIETRPPAHVRSSEHGGATWADLDNSLAWGALIHAHDLTRLGADILGRHDLAKARANGTRWILEAVTFREEDLRHPQALRYAQQKRPGATVERVGPIARILIGVGADGSYSPIPGTPPGHIQGNLIGRLPQKVAQLTVDRECAALKPLLLAQSFLACSNVTLRPVEPSRQERRRHERERPNEPLMRYHIIDVGTRAAARPPRNAIESGSAEHKRALHICRGHFHTYTAERPLFGKHVGRFYIPAHVRGTAEAGISVHDYRVNP